MPEQCAALIDELILLRKSKGWTQQQLAKSCGLTQSVIARLESKRSAPQIDTLFKITQALGCMLKIEPIA